MICGVGISILDLAFFAVPPSLSCNLFRSISYSADCALVTVERRHFCLINVCDVQMDRANVKRAIESLITTFITMPIVSSLQSEYILHFVIAFYPRRRI